MIAITLEDSRSKVFVGGKLSEPFRMSSGVRQGDSISTVLFNLALHEAIKDMRIRGTIMYKSKQCFAYADDIVLVARNIQALKEMFRIIEQKGRVMGFV
jgi:hypothetical protein